MKKRFVVGLASSTPQQEEAFKESLLPLAWWHWVKTMWLIIDEDGILTAADLRDKVKECYPGVFSMVLELRSDGTDTWAGFGPKSEQKNMFTWMKNVWKKRE
ncbi:MAG: hypothetical protein ABSF15_13660 [Candidatus Sulfotelmatobacter sp.]